MKTTDPRVRVENYGRENWRTVARDDSGDWAITGPPYPTRAEALLAVDQVVRYYFGEPADPAPARPAVLSVDVLPARNLRPGDLYAGTVNLDAPTRPVQPCAAAHRVTAVRTFRTDERTWVGITAGPFELSPVPGNGQVLVIRGVS